MLSAYLRSPDRAATPLAAPVSTDLFGTDLRYYAVVDGRAHVSSSVRALARLLGRGRVTLNPLAPVEALAFGLTLRDQTLVREVRSIPPHSTLHPDGTVNENPGPRATARIADPAVAVQRLEEVLEQVIAEQEPRFEVHLAGFTGGKDSRILAALPKRAPERWRFRTVSGRDDAEHRGSLLFAARLGLRDHQWTEWTQDFLDGGVLIEGIGKEDRRHRFALRAGSARVRRAERPLWPARAPSQSSSGTGAMLLWQTAMPIATTVVSVACLSISLFIRWNDFSVGHSVNSG